MAFCTCLERRRVGALGGECRGCLRGQVGHVRHASCGMSGKGPPEDGGAGVVVRVREMEHAGKQQWLTIYCDCTCKKGGTG
jgi:hypothetical protein